MNRSKLRILILLLNSLCLLLTGIGSGIGCLDENETNEVIAQPKELETFFPPVKFTLPDYNPSYWNDGNEDRSMCQMAGTIASQRRQDNNNCYNYANNIDATIYQDTAFAQPGHASQVIIKSRDGNSVKEGAIRDGLEFIGTTYPEVEIENKAIIALLVNDTGFHWVRKDSEGYWSHKNGREPATNKDYGGNLITDPQTANWRNYKFFGYFLIDSGIEEGNGVERIKGFNFPYNICN